MFQYISMMKVRQTNKGNSPDRVPPRWTVLRWINLPSGLAQALKFTQGTGHKTRGLAGATKKQGMRAVSPPPPRFRHGSSHFSWPTRPSHDGRMGHTPSLLPPAPTAVDSSRSGGLFASPKSVGSELFKKKEHRTHTQLVKAACAWRGGLFAHTAPSETCEVFLKTPGDSTNSPNSPTAWWACHRDPLPPFPHAAAPAVPRTSTLRGTAARSVWPSKHSSGERRTSNEAEVI